MPRERSDLPIASTSGIRQETGEFMARCQPCAAESFKEPAGLFEHLLGIGRELLVESDIDRLLHRAMDHLVQYSKADWGVLVLFSKDGGIYFRGAGDSRPGELCTPDAKIDQHIISRIRSRGRPLCSVNAGRAPADDSSAARKTFICLPVRHNQQTISLLYLESDANPHLLSPAHCSFFSSFADFLSGAAFFVLARKQIYYQDDRLEKELRERYRFEAIIGHHPKMVKILKLVSQIAATDATVLIQGESGTGKELIARAIHYNSGRKSKAFIPVNCGALPEHLLESELFGHVRGAFTGAVHDKIGWFERANGGTIFLDEVSEMSPSLQVRLLRVLQTGEYSRVGSTNLRFCNVRVIAASSKELSQLVAAGAFREEVYYRLNVIDINLPPLRERKSDTLLLANHMLKIYGAKYGKKTLRLSRDAEAVLLSYEFPGNVRELENAIQRAVVLSEDDIIDRQHLPLNFCRDWDKILDKSSLSPFRVAKQFAVGKFEREYISDCLQATKGKIRRAAKLAGMDVKNFHGKMKKYDIDPIAFK